MDIKSEKTLEPKKSDSSPESKRSPTSAPPLTPSSISSKAVRSVILAAISFSDAQTGKNYRPGEEVNGWDDERVKEYIKRGVVYRTTQAGPSEVK